MPNRFCAICGNTLQKNAPSYGMCLNCYLNEHPLFELQEKFSFKICPDCGKYSKKDIWIKSESTELFDIIESSIRRFVLKPYLKSNNIKFLISFDKESIVFSSKEMLKSLTSNITGSLESDKKITHEEKVHINLNYELCRNCLNIRGGTYFLSIIQLRVKNDNYFNILKKALDEINLYVEKLHIKDNRQYISKLEDQKFGVDLYLSTNELMKQIIKFLNSNYHFLLKRTKKLVGRDSQRGRNLYRLKSLIKFLPMNKDDTILVENKELMVEKISKNKVLLRDELGNKIFKKFSYFFSEKIKIRNKLEEV